MERGFYFGGLLPPPVKHPVAISGPGFVGLGVNVIWEALKERITKSEEARREGGRGLEA